MKKVKTITSYTGDARFWATVGKKLGYIPTQIRSPYASSPVHVVYQWQGKPIIHVETKHKHYEVFDVSGMTIFKREEQCYRKEVRICN